MEIVVADPTGAEVRPLLDEHLTDMYATSPPESVHALDPEALRHPSITFFVAREAGKVVATGALKDLGTGDVELKSMRTVESVRGRGIGTRMLEHLLSEARSRGYRAMRLETGSQVFFEPARRLYARYGFVEGEPFAEYALDPNSIFMHLELI